MRRTGLESGRSKNQGTGGQSTIEKLNVEAQTILSKKAEEIEQLNVAIGEAEEQLVRLKAEIESKSAVAAMEQDDFEQMEEEDGEADLTKLKAEHDSELQELGTRHEEEIANLRTRYSKALKEAEQWAEQHAETVFIEKSAQLEDLKRELLAIKAQASESVYTQTQAQTQRYQQSKSIALQNAQRIQFLEAQLSELSSVAREELRDVRSKIDECLSAVDIREREHANEIERYEREIAEREQQYNTHLDVLAEQFRNEKQRLDQQQRTAVEKAENMQRVLKQLEKHHELQMQTTLKDNERMKSTIYQAMTKDDQTFGDTKAYASQIHATQYASRQVEHEIAAVNNEIAELQAENKGLQEELRRLESGGRATRSRR